MNNGQNNDFNSNTYYTYDNTVKGRSNGGVAPLGKEDLSGKYAAAAFIMGIISIVSFTSCCIGVVLPPVLPVLAIVFAVMSKNRSEDKALVGKSKAALTLGIISLVIFFGFWIYTIVVMAFFGDSIDYQQIIDMYYKELESLETSGFITRFFK